MQEKLILPQEYNYVISLAFIVKLLLSQKNTKFIIFAPDEVGTWQNIKLYKSHIEKLCMKQNNFLELWEGNYIDNQDLNTDLIKVINWQTMCATLVLGLYDFEKQHSLQPKTFLVSLNRSAIKHKCVFIDTLSKYNLIEGNIISWHKKNYKDYKFKYFDNEKIEIDNIDTPTSCLSYSTEYYKGFIDVICESYDDFPDISEKTYKAIAAKKIFLSVGHKGMYKKLQNLGFELYTELFDYSFDEKTNFHERTELAIKQIKKYENMDYNNMTKKVYSKIEKNYKNFLRIAHNVPNEFIEFINKYDIEYYSKLFEYFRKAKKVY